MLRCTPKCLYEYKHLGVHLSVCMNTNTFSGAYWVQKRGILFGYSKKDYY